MKIVLSSYKKKVCFIAHEKSCTSVILLIAKFVCNLYDSTRTVKFDLNVVIWNYSATHPNKFRGIMRLIDHSFSIFL